MKTIIFGGTTEGREQAALALARGESVLVSVTSEYARQFLPEGAACHIGALDEAAMKAWIAAERPERVIDATHPFAVRATQTIRACADALHIPYVRIERAADRREDWRDAVTWAGNSEEAAALAALCAGNILLTTGSHTLSVYAKVIEPDRPFVRIRHSISARRRAWCRATSSRCRDRFRGISTRRSTISSASARWCQRIPGSRGAWRIRFCPRWNAGSTW